jgi:hypothetical protein
LRDAGHAASPKNTVSFTAALTKPLIFFRPGTITESSALVLGKTVKFGVTWDEERYVK